MVSWNFTYKRSRIQRTLIILSPFHLLLQLSLSLICSVINHHMCNPENLSLVFESLALEDGIGFIIGSRPCGQNADGEDFGEERGGRLNRTGR